MKAMILAAGRGERLRPLTDSRPKPLLEVRGKPLIVWHVEALAAQGYHDIVVNLSWLGSQIQDLLGDGSNFGVSVEFSEESEALETAGGIQRALPLLGESFIVVNADVVTDFDFSRLRQIESHVHLVLVNNPVHHPLGDFSMSEGRVTVDDSPRYTFSGIARYNAEFFAGLKPGKQALAPLLHTAAAKNRVTAELFHGQWIDVGTKERLAAANR